MCVASAAIDFFRAPSNAPPMRRAKRGKRIDQTLASDIRNGIVQGQVFLHEGDKETLIGETKNGRLELAREI
jgi:hypothetical protein